MTDLCRRAILLSAPGLLLAGPALAAVPAGGSLTFQVFRKETRIGQHRLTFQVSGADVAVTTEVEMALALGPVSLFRYAYHASERWSGGRFVSIETRASTNGKKEAVVARRTDKGVQVNKALLSPEAMPLTHWNAETVRAPLFNPQTGQAMRLSAARRPDSYTKSGGAAVKATRISLTGETTLDDWYDSNGVWLALRAKAKDGSIIDYRRA